MSADVHQRLEALLCRLNGIDRSITLPGYAAFRHGTASLEEVAIGWLETLVEALDDAHDKIADRESCYRCDDYADEVSTLENELARTRAKMRDAEARIMGAVDDLRSGS